MVHLRRNSPLVGLVLTILICSVLATPFLGAHDPLNHPRGTQSKREPSALNVAIREPGTSH